MLSIRSFSSATVDDNRIDKLYCCSSMVFIRRVTRPLLSDVSSPSDVAFTLKLLLLAPPSNSASASAESDD